MGYIYFDGYNDSKMRGGVQQFMLGAISPNIHYLESLRIQEIFKNLAEKIKTSEEYSFEEFGVFLEQILANTSPDIGELWIFADNGVDFIHYAPETEMNPDLFSGFLTALQQFTVELSKHKLKNFQTGNSQYSIYREPDDLFYIVAKVSPFISEITLKNILKELHDEFWNRFQSQVEEFYGDISTFRSFKERLKEYIK
jgi:hypothetical protein